ncbi:hypothetical protein [Paenibacillus sedimenti]|nr:hypothetical protein [Paenibacillus sedimenti]
MLTGLVVTSSAFNKNGEFFIPTANSKTMFQFNLSSKEKKEIKLPTLDKEDTISYIAQNPTDTSGIILATFKKDIYISEDIGAKWPQIADKGNGISK